MLNLNLNILGRLNSGGGASIPWYLAGGLIPESDTYTVYDPLNAASLAESYINLAKPGTYDASPVVAPTLGDGWEFTGAESLDSGRPNLATHTIVVWSEGASVNDKYCIGSGKLDVRNCYNAVANNNLTTEGGSIRTLVGTGACSIMILRPGLPIYRNGKINSLSLPAFPVGTDRNMLIGGKNWSGFPPTAGRMTGKIYRYAHYDFLLSDAQCEALTASMLNVTESAYESIVMASNPLVYFPCNHNKGSFLVDKVANVGAHDGYQGVSCGHDGPTGKGKAIKGVTTSTAGFTALDEYPTTAGIDFNEFSLAYWVKNVNADVQARPFNGFCNNLTEYFAPEIRLGVVAIYFLENGTAWNTGNITTVPNNTWVHVVAYNSLSSGRCGVYVNGVKYDFARVATGGFNSGIPNKYYPYICATMTGLMSHVSMYDHALSQSEVDDLYV